MGSAWYSTGGAGFPLCFSRRKSLAADDADSHCGPDGAAKPLLTTYPVQGDGAQRQAVYTNGSCKNEYPEQSEAFSRHRGSWIVCMRPRDPEQNAASGASSQHLIGGPRNQAVIHYTYTPARGAWPSDFNAPCRKRAIRHLPASSAVIVIRVEADRATEKTPEEAVFGVAACYSVAARVRAGQHETRLPPTRGFSLFCYYPCASLDFLLRSLSLASGSAPIQCGIGWLVSTNGRNWNEKERWSRCGFGQAPMLTPPWAELDLGISLSERFTY